MTEFSSYNSPLGKIFMSSDGNFLTGLWFEGQMYAPFSDEKIVFTVGNSVIKSTFRWLDEYFSGKCPDFIPPISIDFLSPFAKCVRKIMLNIPYGEVITYGKIASLIENESGRRVSAQAVGGAVGHNPISIIIPCHRVMGSGGNLTGYAGGIDKKIALLKLEGVDVDKFKLPKR